MRTEYEQIKNLILARTRFSCVLLPVSRIKHFKVMGNEERDAGICITRRLLDRGQCQGGSSCYFFFIVHKNGAWLMTFRGGQSDTAQATTVNENIIHDADPSIGGQYGHF